MFAAKFHYGRIEVLLRKHRKLAKVATIGLLSMITQPALQPKHLNKFVNLAAIVGVNVVINGHNLKLARLFDDFVRGLNVLRFLFGNFHRLFWQPLGQQFIRMMLCHALTVGSLNGFFVVTGFNA